MYIGDLNDVIRLNFITATPTGQTETGNLTPIVTKNEMKKEEHKESEIKGLKVNMFHFLYTGAC